MLPKPALLSSIEVPEPALSLSSAGLALLRVLAASMYFIGTIPDNGTTQPALYSPPHRKDNVTLQYCISGVTNPIENHSCSMILLLLNIRYPRVPSPSHGLF